MLQEERYTSPRPGVLRNLPGSLISPIISAAGALRSLFISRIIQQQVPPTGSGILVTDRTLTLRTRIYTYLQNSLYDVTLTVGNPTCRNANKKINNVVVGRPVADFIASLNLRCCAGEITFTDMSSGTPTSWLWDFGDLSAASTEENPVHIYTVAGTYTVSLTATNAHGQDTRTRTGYITILNPNGVNKIANTTIGD